MSNLKLSRFRESCLAFYSYDRKSSRNYEARSVILNELSKRKRFANHYKKILQILDQYEDDIRLKQEDERKRQERLEPKLYRKL